MTWAEAEYLDLLQSERRACAWVMRHRGGMSLPASPGGGPGVVPPYEPADHPHRGLVFHDEAWHWAMSRIHGGLPQHTPPGSDRPRLHTDSTCQDPTPPKNPSPHPHPSPYPHPMQRAQAIPSITTTPEQVPAR
ncbi:UNVERIFIED_CONTAM: hypothetical protein RKD50_004932 [Streptomyces canus]